MVNPRLSNNKNTLRLSAETEHLISTKGSHSSTFMNLLVDDSGAGCTKVGVTKVGVPTIPYKNPHSAKIGVIKVGVPTLYIPSSSWAIQGSVTTRTL